VTERWRTATAVTLPPKKNPMPNLRPVHPQSEYADLLERHAYPGIEWLDIGCGRQVLPEWAWKPGQQQRVLNGVKLSGLDVDAAIYEHPHLSTRLIGVAENIPAPAETYDMVTANMVMEHVKEPSTILSEVRRVLRQNGLFIIHTPNSRYYLTAIARLVPQKLKNRIIGWIEHRAEADVFPTHYRFNTPAAINRLAGDADFLVENIHICGPYPAFWETPFAAFEKPALWVLSRQGMSGFKSNLIVTLRKPSASVEHG